MFSDAFAAPSQDFSYSHLMWRSMVITAEIRRKNIFEKNFPLVCGHPQALWTAQLRALRGLKRALLPHPLSKKPILPARRSKRGTCYGNVAGWLFVTRRYCIETAKPIFSRIPPDLRSGTFVLESGT